MTFSFYKRLILNRQGQGLITCLQVLNRTLTMCPEPQTSVAISADCFLNLASFSHC